MGIYQIPNLDNGKIYVDASMDLDGARNRLQFMTGMDQSPISELQADWQTYGGTRFVFEVLDDLKPKEEFMSDTSELTKYRKELDALLGLWLEKLQPYGDKGKQSPAVTAGLLGDSKCRSPHIPFIIMGISRHPGRWHHSRSIALGPAKSASLLQTIGFLRIPIAFALQQADRMHDRTRQASDPASTL
jgi:hypothetical protein